MYICLKITHDIGICGHEVLRWRRCCGVGDIDLFCAVMRVTVGTDVSHIYVLTSPQTLFLRSKLLVDEHSCSEDLPYKFNGKQFDDETGLYYYGARYMNPMASIWYGVDAFAEKYVESSGYVFCIDNPIKLIDSDGNKWDIHTSKNKDGKTNVLITVTGVVYNNSSDKKININKVRDQIKAQIESRYTFSSKKYNVKTNINLRVVNSVEDIQKDDHVF